MEYVLETNAISKRYRNFAALNGLSMRVPKGAIYGFVGRNGAGKTTLIRLICGLQEPTSGAFSLYGAKNTDPEIERSRRRMGAVVETPSIYMDMTAEENIRQQYLVLGVPSAEGAEELLRLVGLGDTGKKKAKHFSLGMRQRLGIAVALAGNPDFLVLDEPPNGLDPLGIIEMRELLLRLNRMVREMSAEELEARCRKCMRIEVSDAAALARVLDGMQAEYRILEEDRADIYAEIPVTALVSALERENCAVISLREQDESLESFYMNLIGGGQHA